MWNNLEQEYRYYLITGTETLLNGGEGRLLCGPCLLQNCMSRTCIEKLQLRIEGGVEKFNLFHKYVIRRIVPHDTPCSIYVHLLAMR